MVSSASWPGGAGSDSCIYQQSRRYHRSPGHSGSSRAGIKINLQLHKCLEDRGVNVKLFRNQLGKWEVAMYGDKRHQDSAVN